MKTRKTQFVFFALLALFLLAGNVNAEGTERKVASGLEMKTADEPELILKVWMFDNHSFTQEMALFQRESENTLELEEWMFNPAPLNNKKVCVTEDTEKELEIETWMFNAII